MNKMSTNKMKTTELTDKAFAIAGKNQSSFHN
jgi:hypothetical protein